MIPISLINKSISSKKTKIIPISLINKSISSKKGKKNGRTTPATLIFSEKHIISFTLIWY
jgi:hypothetical protein